ncbi:hypothetical protein ONZ45_g2425 [Pleurotus djamor]|nr:hypothetical protein ONZ45_g2425 [Pleurotus djamor]
MRPAFILFAFAAFVAARPLEASTEIDTFNQLKHSGELDALIEQAFQHWAAEQDDVDFKLPSLKGLGTKLASAGKTFVSKVAPHAKELGSHLLSEVKTHGKDLISHGIAAGAAHVKGQIDAQLAGGDAPPAEEAAPVEERSVDVLDEAVEQAVQEWLSKQTDASLMSLIQSDLNELD